MKDANYRTEENPDSVAKVDNNHTYTYDANGNLVYVNTGRIKQDGTLDSTAAERKLRWDEENRLMASDDNGFVTNYWYDADGERTVKTSGEGEQLYVNSEFAGGRTSTAKFSLYVSGFRGKGGQQPYLYLRCQRQPGLCQYRPHQAGWHIGFHRSRAQAPLGRGEPPDGFR